MVARAGAIPEEDRDTCLNLAPSTFDALLRRPLRAHGSPEINTACPPSGGYVE